MLLLIFSYSSIREGRRGDELKKHHFLHNGVTQLIRKWCFEIFGLREFGVIECFSCTSSVLPNVVRPKSQLKEQTIVKPFKLNQR